MTVFISRDSLKCICKEVQLSRNIETGGILLGCMLKNGDILITHALGPGPNSIRSQNEFKKDFDYSQKMLNILYKKYSIDFLGDWHKHPSNCIDYSTKDYLSMVKITKVNDKQCFFIIVGNDYFNEESEFIVLYSIDIFDNSARKIPFSVVDEPEKIALKLGLREQNHVCELEK